LGRYPGPHILKIIIDDARPIGGNAERSMCLGEGMFIAVSGSRIEKKRGLRKKG